MRGESWICLPTSLIDTQISRDSSLVQSVFMETAQPHFCFDMAHCFEIRLSKIENYVIILCSMRDN